jgi:hypothetical protein
MPREVRAFSVTIKSLFASVAGYYLFLAFPPVARLPASAFSYELTFVARIEKLHAMPGPQIEERHAIVDVLSACTFWEQEETHFDEEQKRRAVVKAWETRSIASTILRPRTKKSANKLRGMNLAVSSLYGTGYPNVPDARYRRWLANEANLLLIPRLRSIQGLYGKGKAGIRTDAAP